MNVDHHPDTHTRIVITGRPNVGKSTLFNRLFGRRRAITDSTPGVTRDAIEEKCTIENIPVLLIDTGGIKPDPDMAFDEIVSHKARQTIKTAHLILFVTDIAYWTAEDQNVVDLLRPYQAKVIVVANKADRAEHEYMASELHATGFEQIIPVSSAHGRNIRLLTQAVKEKITQLNILPAQTQEEENPLKPLKVCIVGRPNAGKSTLTNHISGQQSSLVSDIPGTTRDTVSIFTAYRDQKLLFVDTAGIRRRARVSENLEYYSVNRALKAAGDSDISILLVDSQQGLSSQDKKISAQIVKRGRALIIALNKWDEEKPNKKRLKVAIDKVRFQFPILNWVPILPLSAINGYGVKEIYETLLRIHQQQSMRIETARLNSTLEKWIHFTPPPTSKGRKYRVRYMTQISAKPTKFITFVNHRAGFPDSYKRFLINQIRQEFDFTMVPIMMEISDGGKKPPGRRRKSS